MVATRYQVPVTATSDANGNAAFIFPDAPQAQWVVGTISIANAPGDSIFTANVAGVPWGTWYGPTPSPQVQVDGRLHCEVDAGFLLPTTQYIAWFIGWTNDDPDLISPEAGGPLQLTQANQLVFNGNYAISTAGPNTVFPAIQPWMQALFVRWDDFNDAGSAYPGVHIRITDRQSLGVYLDTVLGSSVGCFVPINGRPVSIALTAITGSAAHSGELTVTALAGPITKPLSYWNGDLGLGRNGNQTVGVVTGAVLAAPNGTTQIIPGPPDGFCLRIKRGIFGSNATAMAAGTTISFRTTVTGQIIMIASSIPANTVVEESMDLWIPQVEGLNVVNTSAVSQGSRLWYEIWPMPLGPAYG